jgi:hypothetical protein
MYNGVPTPVSTRIYARQGPTMTSHSSFLSPYLGSEPASSSSSSSPGQSQEQLQVGSSSSSSSPSGPSPSTSNPTSPTKRTNPSRNPSQRRPPNLTSRSTMMRRRAALEDLCLGVEGVPMHREMLNDFTSVVKRVFGTKMSMVSIMRDEIEMIGMRGEKVGRRGALSSRIESDHEGLIFKHSFSKFASFLSFFLVFLFVSTLNTTQPKRLPAGRSTMSQRKFGLPSYHQLDHAPIYHLPRPRQDRK